MPRPSCLLAGVYDCLPFPLLMGLPKGEGVPSVGLWEGQGALSCFEGVQQKIASEWDDQVSMVSTGPLLCIHFGAHGRKCCRRVDHDISMYR